MRDRRAIYFPGEAWRRDAWLISFRTSDLSTFDFTTSDPVCFRRESVMQSFLVFSSFWLAYVFHILAIQGIDVNVLKSHHSLYNETDDTALKVMFKIFVQTHNRKYVNDPEEYVKRLAVFKVVMYLNLIDHLFGEIVTF